MVAELAAKLKEEGNAAFKDQRYLAAAALYTKALKHDSGTNEQTTAVLYSNRCASLLKLNKVSKAEADAEECLRRRPDWDKAHIRRGAVLEAKGDLQEALTAYQQAEKLSAGSREIEEKVKALKWQLRKQDGGKQKPAQESAAERSLLGFASEVISMAEQQCREDGSGALTPCVYLQGQAQDSGGGRQLKQVSVKSAFDSPDVLQECTADLRRMASEYGSDAACAVVPKAAVAYPQVWKRPGWPGSSLDGVFVQLESLRTKRTWFVPYKDGLLGKRIQLSEDFRLLGSLFR